MAGAPADGGAAPSIYMSAKALARKRQWETKHAARFHLVVAGKRREAIFRAVSGITCRPSRGRPLREMERVDLGTIHEKLLGGV